MAKSLDTMRFLAHSMVPDGRGYFGGAPQRGGEVLTNPLSRLIFSRSCAQGQQWRKTRTQYSASRATSVVERFGTPPPLREGVAAETSSTSRSIGAQMIVGPRRTPRGRSLMNPVLRQWPPASLESQLTVGFPVRHLGRNLLARHLARDVSHGLLVEALGLLLFLAPLPP